LDCQRLLLLVDFDGAFNQLELFLREGGTGLRTVR
jgi:hypothetical protein